jgi:broad specificity phosphatase PhoE
VRHAEKDAGDDPSLTAEGRARAEALAIRMENAGIERVLATATRRAQETATPVARRLGLEVELYDPRALDALAEELRTARRSVLVVGHSNTNPTLVRKLGGDPGPPIEESEYDRVYRVDLGTGIASIERMEAPSVAAP